MLKDIALHIAATVCGTSVGNNKFGTQCRQSFKGFKRKQLH